LKSVLIFRHIWIDLRLALHPLDRGVFSSGQWLACLHQPSRSYITISELTTEKPQTIVARVPDFLLLGLLELRTALVLA